MRNSSRSVIATTVLPFYRTPPPTHLTYEPAHPPPTHMLLRHVASLDALDSKALLLLVVFVVVVLDVVVVQASVRPASLKSSSANNTRSWLAGCYCSGRDAYKFVVYLYNNNSIKYKRRRRWPSNGQLNIFVFFRMSFCISLCVPRRCYCCCCCWWCYCCGGQPACVA